MDKRMVVRGVPRSLALDGWWLSADADVPDDPSQDSKLSFQDVFENPTKRRLVLLLLVLGLGDVLLYRQVPGISVALFAVIIFAASSLEQGETRHFLGPVAVLSVSILPVIEYFQTASVAIVLAGLIVSVSWSRIGIGDSLQAVLFASRRMIAVAPIEGIRSGIKWIKVPSGRVDLGDHYRRFVRNWAFPLGGAALIGSLLVSANPVLEGWLGSLWQLDVDLANLLSRILFWGGLALGVWPLLAVEGDRLTNGINGAPVKTRTWHMGLNAKSVTNSLVIFNCMLALQLVLDGQFFWLGGQLPEGMSYASYAHRGAYPLLVTALLAGGFALASRPFLNEARVLKPLMTVWLGLNVMLTLSSMYRLGLYVDVYGLTYFRVRAGIWMGLVAIWLCLIARQILAERESRWLVLRSFALGAGTVYVGCFINFAHYIAEFNANHGLNDVDYICSLGALSRTGSDSLQWGTQCPRVSPEIYGWRDWGYRKWRVARYIEQKALMEAADEIARGR